LSIFASLFSVVASHHITGSFWSCCWKSKISVESSA